MNDTGSPFLAISRRSTLAGLSGSALLAAVPSALLANPAAKDPVFRHGVASGDPDQHSVVLWTRVSLPGLTRVEWELSATPEFIRIARRGTVLTGPDRDHTVKLVASGLAQGSTWYFRFRAGGQTSPVGRARTLPAGSLSPPGHRAGIVLQLRLWPLQRLWRDRSRCRSGLRAPHWRLHL